MDIQTAEGTLNWMLDKQIVVRRSSKDPETLAVMRGYVLSNEFHEKTTANLVELFGKAEKSRNEQVRNLTVRDALLTASLGAIVELTGEKLSEDEITQCANVIMALLPIGTLNHLGLAHMRLRRFVRDRRLVAKVRKLMA